jgi:hypothetical protein
VLRADSCEELACNDDSLGAVSKASSISPPARRSSRASMAPAGRADASRQTVSIVVDGYGGSAGAYLLQVSR